MDDINKVKRLINTIIYGIFGIIVAIVLIRILLRLLGANPEAGFVVFLYQLSDNFVGLFRGIYPNLETTVVKNTLEVYSVLALCFYIILSYLSSKLFISVTKQTALNIINSFVDSFFKIAEFLLIVRFLLKITGASTASQFVTFIYGFSAVIYEPFVGILPTFKVGDMVFETSTLIAIVIIIIFDIVTENIISKLFADLKSHPKQEAAVVTSTVTTHQPAPIMQPAPMMQPIMQPAPQMQPSNITINIPQPMMPQQQPQAVDNRTVHIYNPLPQAYPQQQPYPGYGANDLERRRPVINGQLPQGQPQPKNAFYSNPPPAPRQPWN